MDADSHSLDTAMFCVEKADNTDYDSNMHISPIRYVADNVGLVICAHFKIYFFHEVQTACTLVQPILRR